MLRFYLFIIFGGERIIIDPTIYLDYLDELKKELMLRKIQPENGKAVVVS